MMVIALGALACQPGEDDGGVGGGDTVALAPTRMAAIDTIDERYQSYNVEMLEVTGGKFWRPYGPTLDSLLKQPAPAPAPGGDTPAGMNPALYQYRPPIDLTNARLRKMAAALGPAYVRVSGTWANTTYFPESERADTATPPGFGGVLTHAQWRGVIDFVRATDGAIVTSFATGAGVRDASGAWKPDLARRWVEFTRAAGGKIAAAEFMNEPTLAAMGGAPTGYDAAAYGRDFKRFRAFADKVVPNMIVLGPGSVGETVGEPMVEYGTAGTLRTRDMLQAARPATVDAFSYHHYGASSIRCASMGPKTQTSADSALSEAWLRRTDETLAFYRRMRDEFAPGVPFWNTETADAACGGNPWANTFLDTFRYLDQLGRLARQDVRVIAHNTLVASDYGLLDDSTFAPKPNYWGALLWRRLMGTTVLDAGVPIQEGLHVYAHCLRSAPGGVAVLALNTDRSRRRTLSLPTAAERFTLSAPTSDLQSRTVRLNGTELALGAGDALPQLAGDPTPAGAVEVAPGTITFLATREANNAACR